MIKNEDTTSVNIGTGSSKPTAQQPGFTVPTKPTQAVTKTKPKSLIKKKNNRVVIQTSKIPKSQRGRR
jgi:hypothetical protein